VMKRCPWLVPLLLLLPFTAGAAESAAVDAVLARLEREAAKVTTLSSDFVQEKHLAMFAEVMTSKGRFAYARPDRLRWELLEPVATGFVLKGKEGRRWNDRSGRSEAFDLQREPMLKVIAEQLLAWTRADFPKLRQEYRISVVTEAPVVLRLQPLAEGGPIGHLLIAFAADASHVTRVEIHDRDGDFTRLTFVNTVVNPELPAATF